MRFESNYSKPVEKTINQRDVSAESGKEFIFKLKDGKEVGKAGTLNGFESLIRNLPIESLEFHNAGKHFSAWLRYLKQDRMANAFDKINSKGERLRQDLLDAIKSNR